MANSFNIITYSYFVAIQWIRECFKKCVSLRLLLSLLFNFFFYFKLFEKFHMCVCCPSVNILFILFLSIFPVRFAFISFCRFSALFDLFRKVDWMYCFTFFFFLHLFCCLLRLFRKLYVMLWRIFCTHTTRKTSHIVGVELREERKRSVFFFFSALLIIWKCMKYNEKVMFDGTHVGHDEKSSGNQFHRK